ncbi:Homeobox protein Hox-B10a [Acipenser ruthenus]|uniref:Homeobox protein Hox-B10a n=1 Tax=Acipenser ruthenus TaxID=7906 RepID=A0A444UHX9_ACIRT|nr:homeobox protein Hox-B10a-like [Acipenser ruthenus]RXM34773.1 Homeobox protein Hox-B10a [Acipenser ruthenus]
MSCSERSVSTSFSVNSLISGGAEETHCTPRQPAVFVHDYRVQHYWGSVPSPTKPGEMNDPHQHLHQRLHQQQQQQHGFGLPEHHFLPRMVNWVEHSQASRGQQLRPCPYTTSNGKDESYFFFDTDKHSKPLPDVSAFTRLMSEMGSLSNASGNLQSCFRPDQSYTAVKPVEYTQHHIPPAAHSLSSNSDSATQLFNLSYPALQPPCTESDKRESDDLSVCDSVYLPQKSNNTMKKEGRETVLLQEKPPPEFPEDDKTIGQDTQGHAGVENAPGSWLTAKAGRKKRSPYSKHQTLELEKEFLFNMYLTRERRLEISRGVDLTDRQVKIWFQNRRMKLKKMSREHRVRDLTAHFPI